MPAEQGIQSYLQNLMGELVPQANEEGDRVAEDQASSQANEGEEGNERCEGGDFVVIVFFQY